MNFEVTECATGSTLDKSKTETAPAWRPTRRDLLGYTSLVALALPSPALATDTDVQEAMQEDFGTTDLPDGDVVIDMPDFSDSGKSVPLSVTVPCSMEGQDYPEVVAVYAPRNPRPRVVRAYFTPACSEATFSTRVRIDSYQDITVAVKMADGRMFKGVRKVDVTYGACEDKLASDQFPPGWSPKIRVAVPDAVAPGEVAPIRTIIGHPMETGFRYNSSGLKIPVRIAEWFRCTMNGELVFSMKLEPAISANPYLAFSLTIQEPADLHFEWVDTTSDVYSEDAHIDIA